MRFIWRVLALAGIAIVVMFACVAGVGYYTMTHVPMVPDEMVQAYQGEAAQISGLDWHWLASIEAVRLRQDFSMATAQDAHSLAHRFTEVIHGAGQDTYRLRQPDDVMRSLGFSDEEHELAWRYHNTLAKFDTHRDAELRLPGAG